MRSVLCFDRDFAVIWWWKHCSRDSLRSSRFYRSDSSPCNPNRFRLLRPHNYGCNLPETGFHEDSVATYRLRGTRASANKLINKILTAQASHAVMHHLPSAQILNCDWPSWDFSRVTRKRWRLRENSTQSHVARSIDRSRRKDAILRSGFPCDRSVAEIKCRSNGLRKFLLRKLYVRYIKTTRSSIFS